MRKGLSIGLIISIMLSIGYTAVYASVDDTLGFNITINDVDCSLKTPDEAQKIIMNNYYDNMNFIIHDEYSDTDFEVTSKMFNFAEASKAKDFYLKTDGLKWVVQLIKARHFMTGDGNAIDKLVDYVLDNNIIYNDSNRDKAINASIEYNASTKRFEIKNSVAGTIIDREVFKEKIKDHIKNGSGDYIIDDTNFKKPDINENDERLINLCNELNELANLKVENIINGNTEKFDIDNIYKYINIDYNNFSYSFDKDNCAKDYVNTISNKYNTYDGKTRFNTHDGKIVDIQGGNWGLQLNSETSTKNIIKYLNSKNTNDFKLEWIHDDGISTGFVNYVEVDLTDQHVYLYKNGELIADGNCVSGKAKGHNTPAGVYHLSYKARNQTLRGYNDDGSRYSSFVNYWMPFNGGIGLHDATWRSKFGGTIYKNSGSHGCINLPKSLAKTIYENIDSSYAIVCYWD